MDLKRSRFEIEILSRNYLKSKRLLADVSNHIIDIPPYRLENHKRIVYHIEYIAETLCEKERFIIRKEVMEGKKGKWYLEYFAPSSYYRIRKKAYENFLNCL